MGKKYDYNIEQHKKMIEIQLLNERDEDEEISKVYEIVRNNIFRIYIETGVSISEFALMANVSSSTLKRIFRSDFSERERLNLNSLLKIAVNLNIPIECIVSNLTPGDIEFVKKYHQLEGVEKKKIESEIDNLTTCRCNNKVHKKRAAQDNEENIPKQMDIFEILKDMEDTNKCEIN